MLNVCFQIVMGTLGNLTDSPLAHNIDILWPNLAWNENKVNWGTIKTVKLLQMRDTKAIDKRHYLRSRLMLLYSKYRLI